MLFCIRKDVFVPAWLLSKTFKFYLENVQGHHCFKSVRIRCYSGPYFSAFGLNTGRYEASLVFSLNAGKYQ